MSHSEQCVNNLWGRRCVATPTVHGGPRRRGLESSLSWADEVNSVAILPQTSVSSLRSCAKPMSLASNRRRVFPSKGTFQNFLCFGSVDKAATAPASNQAVACSQACETLVFDEYICTEKIDRKQLRLLLKNLQQERTKRNACLRWLSSKDTLNVVESSHQKAHDVDKAKPGYI